MRFGVITCLVLGFGTWLARFAPSARMPFGVTIYCSILHTALLPRAAPWRYDRDALPVILQVAEGGTSGVLPTPTRHQGRPSLRLLKHRLNQDDFSSDGEEVGYHDTVFGLAEVGHVGVRDSDGDREKSIVGGHLHGNPMCRRPVLGTNYL